MTRFFVPIETSKRKLERDQRDAELYRKAIERECLKYSYGAFHQAGDYWTEFSRAIKLVNEGLKGEGRK